MANKNVNGDVNVSFTEAASRQSLESGESVKTLFGKLRKWLSDLKPVAFSGSYNDLTDKTMTGYTKPASTSAITTSDTINEAIGKLEKGLEDAGGGSEGLEEHIETNVEDEGGVHGIRCYNGKLEVYNAYSEEWLDPSEVGVAVGNVSNLSIQQGAMRLELSWSDPNDEGEAIWKGTKVVMKAGAYPENLNDGQLVYDNQIKNAFSTKKLVINNLTANSTYYFMLFPYTTTGIATIDNNNRISGTALAPIELGLRVDFVNKTFTRLGDAEGLSGGTDFDDFPMYKRRRCNLADDGTVNAYLGKTGYSSTGSNGQVMVEQPKFYYKVVPVTLNASDNKQIDVAEYWVSDEPLEGYKLHPAFYNTSGQEIDYFYEGAYEGYIDYNYNKLYSKSDVVSTPKLSRYTYNNYAVNRGAGWRIETIWSVSADQLLMLIEYGKFNMQEAIGNGNVGYSGTYLQTGVLDYYKNGSYGTTDNQDSAVQWRGKENPWGNRTKHVNGIDMQRQFIYIANDYDFKGATLGHYTQLGFQLASHGNYTGRFGYDENYDWIFIPYGTEIGDSTSPVGDGGAMNILHNQWLGLTHGGGMRTYSWAGAFNWSASLPTSTDNSLGARLLYVG